MNETNRLPDADDLDAMITKSLPCLFGSEGCRTQAEKDAFSKWKGGHRFLGFRDGVACTDMPRMDVDAIFHSRERGDMLDEMSNRTLSKRHIEMILAGSCGYLNEDIAALEEGGGRIPCLIKSDNANIYYILSAGSGWTTEGILGRGCLIPTDEEKGCLLEFLRGVRREFEDELMGFIEWSGVCNLRQDDMENQ
ncbi:MAG: hypothetical protein EOM65_04860 [Synergistales bacterium]|nr:hypothetical protein [Synergistales bacterium]